MDYQKYIKSELLILVPVPTPFPVTSPCRAQAL